MFHQRPVDLPSRCRSPPEPVNLLAVLIRQTQKLSRRFHRLGGSDNYRFGEKSSQASQSPVMRTPFSNS